MGSGPDALGYLRFIQHAEEIMADERTDAEWRDILTADEYEVLRNAATERAFTGEYCDEKGQGTYRCRGCGAALFSSDAKYDSGSGWPSFYEALDPEAVESRVDTSHGMTRTEVVCRACGGHLGHQFPDGPQPSGQRFCVNSLSLELEGNADGPTADVAEE